MGMPSKRGGRIHPSVTSHPPRHTARTGRAGYAGAGDGTCDGDGDGDGGGFTAGRGVLLAAETEQRHGAHRSTTTKQRRLTSGSSLAPPRQPIGSRLALAGRPLV